MNLDEMMEKLEQINVNLQNLQLEIDQSSNKLEDIIVDFRKIIEKDIDEIEQIKKRPSVIVLG